MVCNGYVHLTVNYKINEWEINARAPNS